MGIVLILLLIFIIRKKTKLIHASIFLLIIFSNGIFSEVLWKSLEYPWKRLDYSLVDYSDAIVVLSSSRHLPPGNTKIIEWSDPDRFLAGIDLFKAGKSMRLIFTGGVSPYSSDLPPEGDIYLREAISMGIPRENIFTTDPITNTLQEAKAIKKLLNDEIPLMKKKIILVTSAFHMKRAKKVFEREGINVLPYPVDFKSSKNISSYLKNPLNWLPSSHNLDRSSKAIREIIGRIIYRSWK